MKKISIILAALATAFAVSCNKEVADIDTPDPSVPAGMKEVTISASIDDTATKTSYDAAGKFSWTKGDQIAIKGSDNQFYTFTAITAGSSSTFIGYIPETVTLQKHALYPAESASIVDGAYYYTIPEYKDLSESASADIPMSSYVAAGTYNFVHMTGAALLTFTNIPDGVDDIEISIVANTVRLSGTQQVWSGTPFTFSGATAANESEKTFIRKVSVKDNTAQVYLPYKGEFWDSCTINITATSASGDTMHLLTNKKMSGSSANVYKPKDVIPYTPLALPDYVEPVDWSSVNWNSVDESQSYVQPEWFITDYPGRVALSELRVIADDNYVYARVKPYAGADVKKIRFKFADTIGGETQEWYWSTSYTSAYKSSWADVTDNEFTLDYNGYPVELQVEVVDEDVYWNLAFPRIAHELTKSSGTVYFGILSYGAGTDSESDYENGFVPMIWNEMMTVTLP